MQRPSLYVRHPPARLYTNTQPGHFYANRASLSLLQHYHHHHPPLLPGLKREVGGRPSDDDDDDDFQGAWVLCDGELQRNDAAAASATDVCFLQAQCIPTMMWNKKRKKNLIIYPARKVHLTGKQCKLNRSRCPTTRPLQSLLP